MAIKVFVTGGTFDKRYEPVTEKLVFGESNVKEMLEFGRFAPPVNIEVLMMMDSLQMTDVERQLIAKKCAECPEKQILVTHGTGTMVETARVIQALHLDKTIVLTGAMVPYRMFGSDSLFNMGTALVLVQTLPSGVYMGVNGQCFDPSTTHKNQEQVRFEAE